MSITAPASVPSGAKAAVGGKATLATAATPKGVKVTLQRRERGTTAWHPLATVRTGPSGRYALKATVTRTTQVRARISGATSPTRTIAARQKITVTSTGSRGLDVGGRITLTGTTSPGLRGTTLRLQRSSGGGWGTAASTRASTGGTWTLAATAATAGHARAYRVVSASTASIAQAASPTVTYDVYGWYYLSNLTRTGEDWFTSGPYQIDGKTYRSCCVSGSEPEGAPLGVLVCRPNGGDGAGVCSQGSGGPAASRALGPPVTHRPEACGHRATGRVDGPGRVLCRARGPTGLRRARCPRLLRPITTAAAR